MGDLAKLAVQLTPVESLRAVVLLEEALKQFAFLGRLAKDPKTIKCSQICASSGDDIVRILGEQQELGQMYASCHSTDSSYSQAAGRECSLAAPPDLQ